MKTIIAFRFTSGPVRNQVTRELEGLLFLPPGCEVQLYEYKTLPVEHTVFNPADHRMEVTLTDWHETDDEDYYRRLCQQLEDDGWSILDER